jgi:hypothetical protein
MGDTCAWQPGHIIRYLKAPAQSSSPSHCFWDTVRNVGKSAVSDLLREHDLIHAIVRAWDCSEGTEARRAPWSCFPCWNAGRAELLPTTTGAASGTSTMGNNTPKSPTTWA